MKSKTIVLSLAAALMLSACGGVDPDSPTGKRQAVFKEILRVSEDISGMFRGRLHYDEARFATDATRLEQLSRQPWQYFPEEQDNQAGNASDRIWSEQARFRTLADEFEAATTNLVGTVAEKADDQRRAVQEQAMQRVEDSCRACHQEFRSY